MKTPKPTKDATRVRLILYVANGELQELASQLCRLGLVLARQVLEGDDNLHLLIPQGTTDLKDIVGDSVLARMETIDR